jgi:hypothetical protein
MVNSGEWVASGWSLRPRCGHSVEFEDALDPAATSVSQPRRLNLDEAEKMQHLTDRSNRSNRVGAHPGVPPDCIAHDEIEITLADPCFLGQFLVRGGKGS